MFGIVRDHAATKKEAMSIRRAEQARTATPGKPFVGQAECIANCGAQNRADNRFGRHDVSPDLSSILAKHLNFATPARNLIVGRRAKA